MTARTLRLLAGLGLIAALILPAAAPVAAANGLTMEARPMLDGHARIGAWMAVAVRLKNDGPPVAGELRLAGGSGGKSRFGLVVDSPTQSDKTYLMYVQPPAFGRELTVSLVDGDTTLASTKVGFTIHDGAQLVVGVIAERPQGIVSTIDLLPNQNQIAPVILPLDPTQLPDRVEAWQTLDRLVWQDVDSSVLSTAQITALRGWIAGGGRLVIVGGTSGPGALGAFPDDLLPYRPAATLDVPAASLTAFLGSAPAGASDLPALSGSLTDGRSLAVVGDRVIAAERSYGSGATTLIGFDPTVDWIAGGTAADSFWRRLLPQRANAGLSLSDDSQLISAVSQLPSLALPPVAGLFALLVGYILLVGPINYLVLRRLGRREWAWATIPALIAVFAVGAYGFGYALRGSDVIVNEIALVRGAPGTTVGTAQVYVGIFSPSRGTYQVRVPGGALLSPPVSGDQFGSDPATTALDVLQGDPARVRDLMVGFGSLRTLRAETAVAVPLVQADLRLERGRLKGTVKNASDRTLEKPAVVIGATVAILKDLGPGEQATVDTAVQNVANQFGQPLSDLVVGPLFFDGSGGNPDSERYIRHAIVDQLTYDPNFGSTNQLPADGAVILAWSDGDLLAVDIEGQEPRRTGSTLYYLPAPVAVSGLTTFTSDLLRSSVVASDAAFFSKDPFSMNFGRGSATLAYRPITMNGSIATDQLMIALNFGGDAAVGEPTPIVPLDAIPVFCSAEVVEDCVQSVKVWEYLDFFGRCYGLSAAARRRTIGDLLELVDLADKRDDYVQTLSRGMEQRLCLAHALVHDPQVLLLDEPASGLDPRARVELRELLRELRTLGKTILISSHILPELEELCTSVAIIDRGRVLDQGRVIDIERRLRFGAVLHVRVLAEGDALEAARARFESDPDVATAELLHDGTIQVGFRGDDAASARLLADAVRDGLPIVTFSRAASDLEELFLQVTAPDRTPVEAA